MILLTILLVTLSYSLNLLYDAVSDKPDDIAQEDSDDVPIVAARLGDMLSAPGIMVSSKF